MGNVRKDRDVKLVTNKSRRNYFGVRTKLSYNKVFFRLIYYRRNEKNTNINELTCLFRSINITNK